MSDTDIRTILITEPRHLDVDAELIPYVDGKLDAAGLEIVETHLEDCPSCRAEMDDLRAFREQLVGRRPPRRRYAFAAAAAAVLIAAAIWLAVPDRAPTHVAASQRYDNAAWETLVDSTRRNGLVIAAKPELLTQGEGVVRGNGAAAAASLSPTGIVIESTQPHFAWPASPNGSYHVTVYDGDQQVAESDRLMRPEWTPQKELARGRTYLWQVETGSQILPAAPAPPAAFHIISDADHAELERARARYPGDHLLLAALYARVGMEAEAREEMRLAR